MSKFKQGDRVVRKHGSSVNGIVKQVLPNPFYPEWLASPNYLVFWDGDNAPDVCTKKEIRLLKPPKTQRSLKEKLHKIFWRETEIFIANPQV